MIYTCITGNDTLLFFNNRSQMASINFKSELNLLDYLKMCIFNKNKNKKFNDLLDENNIIFSTLTKYDIYYINLNYYNIYKDFFNHIIQIERG